MGRLTKRREDGSAYIENGLKGMLGVAVDKLADLEDAEENGLLVKLPCKVGDTVYRFSERFVDGKIQILEKKISWIEVYSNNEFVISVDGYPYSQRDFNKIFFFTREEAEKALKERNNENWAN